MRLANTARRYQAQREFCVKRSGSHGKPESSNRQLGEDLCCGVVSGPELLTVIALEAVEIRQDRQRRRWK